MPSGQTHAPSAQTVEPGHSPQPCPQPSGPHSAASQLGVQQAPSTQPSPAGQHVLLPQSGPWLAHWQLPSTHTSGAAQPPQVPPQPSEPHVLPTQSGLQQAPSTQPSSESQQSSPQGMAHAWHVQTPAAQLALSGQQLSPQVWVMWHWHTPSLPQLSPGAHAPHSPPQPSSPQAFPEQSGTHPRLSAAESSEVLPPPLVAVAVTKAPGRAAAGRLSVKLASPAASVVTEKAPT